MACSVPHTYGEIKSMIEKQIQEDRGRQLAIMNLGHQFDSAITDKDELRKAYKECRDIPLEQRVLIENFLKIVTELDYQMQNALFRNMTKLEKQIRDKNKWLQQLKETLMIFGSFGFEDFRIIYAWALEVEGGFVSSCRLLFTIPHLADHHHKLLGFCNDKEPIVEAMIVQQWYKIIPYMFTKALPEDRFKYLVRRLGMRCLTPEELEVLENESA
ncbi:hypothetical protein Tco_0088486 [Tanacetum coccineum]